jgi:hypothetical protein
MVVISPPNDDSIKPALSFVTAELPAPYARGIDVVCDDTAGGGDDDPAPCPIERIDR